MPSWHHDAACNDKPLAMFFGSEDNREGTLRHRPVMSPREIEAAKRVCAPCPVLHECLVHALTNREQYGIWAGTTPQERKEWWEASERLAQYD